jgi:xanthine dehydrogenase accessory factor
MNEWVHSLQLCGESGHDAVLVAVLSGKGSTPRDAGAKMVVTADAVHGTIGGGELEYRALDIARALLRSSGGKQTHRFPLGASLGQICGGAANLAFERVAAGAEWVRVLARRHAAGTPSVLVTPSTPDDTGCLIVDGDAVWGSLGGGPLEAHATALAREMLARDDSGPQVVTLDGHPHVVLEAVRPVDFEIALFGAGHVGRALARVLGTLACRVTWIDARAGEFPPEIAGNVRRIVTDAALDEVSKCRPGTFFLVLTHSHALDFELVEAILKRGDFGYCGMIGSATKRRTFEKGLIKKGVPSAALARFTCPIGIETIKGKEPATIAIAVAAQLLELRERAVQGKGDGCNELPKRRA